MGGRAARHAWTVVVVEDDVRARQYFSQCVQASSQLLLLAAFGSVAQACAWIRSTDQRPEVLLTDLGLPDGSGITVIREMRQRFPDCETLVISMFGDDDHVFASIEAGALGYIPKDSLPQDVAAAILDLKAGTSPISPGIARRLLLRFRDGDRGPRKATAGGKTGAASARRPARRLTEREVEILDYLTRGFSYQEIAELTGLKRNTVASHVRNLYRKMHVHSRGEAVFEASQAGIIRMPGR